MNDVINQAATFTNVANADPEFLDRGTFETDLKSRLQENPCRVWFQKRDGSQREMLCTLEESAITPYESKTDRTKTPNPNIMPVWDIEAAAWRSIPLDRVFGYTLRAIV